MPHKTTKQIVHRTSAQTKQPHTKITAEHDCNHQPHRITDKPHLRYELQRLGEVTEQNTPLPYLHCSATTKSPTTCLVLPEEKASRLAGRRWREAKLSPLTQRSTKESRSSRPRRWRKKLSVFLCVSPRRRRPGIRRKRAKLVLSNGFARSTSMAWRSDRWPCVPPLSVGMRLRDILSLSNECIRRVLSPPSLNDKCVPWIQMGNYQKAHGIQQIACRCRHVDGLVWNWSRQGVSLGGILKHWFGQI